MKQGGAKDGPLPIIEALLQWEASKRLGAKGSEEVLGHGYWGQPEWDLVHKRKIASPLRCARWSLEGGPSALMPSARRLC